MERGGTERTLGEGLESEVLVRTHRERGREGVGERGGRAPGRNGWFQGWGK